MNNSLHHQTESLISLITSLTSYLSSLPIQKHFSSLLLTRLSHLRFLFIQNPLPKVLESKICIEKNYQKSINEKNKTNKVNVNQNISNSNKIKDNGKSLKASIEKVSLEKNKVANGCEENNNTITNIYEKMMTKITDIQKNLFVLSNNHFFQNIGENIKNFAIFEKVLLLFHEILNLVSFTNIKTDLEKLKIINLKHQMENIDLLACKIIEKDKNYKNSIPEGGAFPGELAIIFTFLNLDDEITISWALMASNLRELIYKLEGINLTEHSMVKIRKIIDRFSENAITFHAINYFFNFIWVNPEERDKILFNSDCIINVKEISQNPSKPKLKLKVIKNSDNDDFKVGDELEITHLGYVNSPIPRNDGTVFFGRRTQTNPAIIDVFFRADNKSVSRRQFQISFLEEDLSYSLICISKVNPTLLQIREKKHKLESDQIIQLGSDEFFHVSRLYHKKSMPSEDSITYICPEGRDNQTFTQRETIEQTLIRQARPAFVDILYELNTLSILDLPAPDLLPKEIKKDKKIEKNEKETIALNSNPISETKDLKRIIVEEKRNMPNTSSFLELTPLKSVVNQTIIVSCDTSNTTKIFNIGRRIENFLVIPNPIVSGIHCQILYESEVGWWIGEKLNEEMSSFSHNGTFVFCKAKREYNHKQPSKGMKLESGMVIWAGDVAFEVEIF